MRASEAGAALALQPEDEGERTALSRLREIYRRATAYRLPCPFWDDEPGRYCDLNPTGADALVLRDGMGSDAVDGEAAEGARVDDAEPCPALAFDPTGSDIAEGCA
jgi:hypothetical protein